MRRRGMLQCHMIKKAEENQNGARGRIRTTDTAIFSRMLYQLSYSGTPGSLRGSGLLVAVLGRV